jgi:hypothetical protein
MGIRREFYFHDDMHLVFLIPRVSYDGSGGGVERAALSQSGHYHHLLDGDQKVDGESAYL